MATTVDLGKVRPVWKGTWSSGTAYEVHDMVKSGLDSYICTTGHTSSGTFSNDSANWDTLATGFSGDASDITSGTIPAARFPSTLPAVDGSALTGISSLVLQVVVSSSSTEYSTTSSSHSNTVSATITPTSASSKIYVQIVTNGNYNGAYNQFGGFGIKRDSTTLISESAIANDHRGFDHRETRTTYGRTLNYLDSPATTSEITYYLTHNSNGTTNYVNRESGEVTTITLWELAI